MVTLPKPFLTIPLDPQFARRCDCQFWRRFTDNQTSGGCVAYLVRTCGDLESYCEKWRMKPFYMKPTTRIGGELVAAFKRVVEQCGSVAKVTRTVGASLAVAAKEMNAIDEQMRAQAAALSIPTSKQSWMKRRKCKHKSAVPPRPVIKKQHR